MKTSIGALIVFLFIYSCGVSVNIDLSNQQQTDAYEEPELYQDFEYNPLTMNWVLMSTGIQCEPSEYSGLAAAISALKNEVGISVLYQRNFAGFAPAACGRSSGKFYGAVVYKQELYKITDSGWFECSEEKLDSLGLSPID